MYLMLYENTRDALEMDGADVIYWPNTTPPDEWASGLFIRTFMSVEQGVACYVKRQGIPATPQETAYTSYARVSVTGRTSYAAVRSNPPRRVERFVGEDWEHEINRHRPPSTAPVMSPTEVAAAVDAVAVTVVPSPRISPSATWRASWSGAEDSLRYTMRYMRMPRR